MVTEEIFTTDKYQSITTPDIYHDAANMLTELIWLNKDVMAGPYPWRGSAGRDWGKTVSAIKKLMRDFDITADQMAFYVFKCSPQSIDGVEFAKMAVVAKKLFRILDLNELRDRYQTQRDEAQPALTANSTRHKSKRSKSLTQFIKELESGEA